MKKYIFLLLTLALLASCENSVTDEVTYSINEPVFMSRADFQKSVKVSTQSREITAFGKMTYYQGYLFVSETDKGVHIIDNTDPSNPQNIGFIELMGNADLAIRNNLLYADSYADLVWFDVSNPAVPILKGRMAKMFPEVLPPVIDVTVGIDYAMCYDESKSDSVIVGWKTVTRTEDVDEYSGGWFWNWGWLKGDVETLMMDGSGSTGVNGSMSRFALYQNYLYSVMNSQMTIFELDKDTVPVKVTENFYVSWNVETIFSYEDKMFLGTPTGMSIYSVANPELPIHKSTISHVLGCDPVVVEDDLAYVTVHSGNNCGQNTNQLLIYNVEDVTTPKLLVTYAMEQPKGLGIDNKILFVCDAGLKIFNASNPQTIMANQLAYYQGMEGYDVIPFNNVIMMMAEDGIYQYDYSNLEDIKLLSKIPIVAN